MNEEVTTLMTLLEREYAIYQKLYEISAKKTDVIVAGKVAALDEIVKVEEQLVLGVGKFEREREAIVEKLAQTLQKPGQNFTLSVLIEALDDTQAKQLTTVQQQISDVLHELTEKNNLNMQLLQHSMDYVQFSLNLLSGQDETAGVYGKSGGDIDAKPRHLLNQKA